MSHPLLVHYPVIVQVPIQWGDLDAYGHVNNTVFFKLFESARIAYLEACGFIASYEEDREGAILHSTACRFRKPLNFPDDVLVGGRTTEVGEDRFEMGYAIVSTTHDHLAGEGTATIVSFDYTNGKKAAMPTGVASAISDLERTA
jgi:acyl-CoA thioester hydrolase